MNDNYSILVVDDQLESLHTITDCIDRLNRNFNVFRATNGNLALEIAAAKIPEVIITDWDMPQMNGIELIRNLKNNPLTADIPVIMCTGIMLTSDNLKTALEAGAFDYIRKPIDKVELEARLFSALRYLQKHQKLVELNSTKDKFFSIIAHDLKNPFNIILGYSGLLIDRFTTLSNEKILQAITSIHSATDNSYKLLENLLQWARNQSDNIEFYKENYELEYIVKQAVNYSNPLAQKKDISIIVSFDSTTKISVDINMILTVLRNLISNAIKYTNRNGEIHIQTFTENESLIIELKDNGIGMTQSKIDKLFKISEKVTTLGTEKEVGTGLGLLLCKDFIEKHNGKIWVKSEVNKGTSFFISIPI